MGRRVLASPRRRSSGIVRGGGGLWVVRRGWRGGWRIWWGGGEG